jgi:putative SOS response-associated peptidase YedK
MCGRYTHLFTWEELHRLSTLTTPRVDLPRSFNVAPTHVAPVVRLITGGPGVGRGLSMLKWGLVPFWAEDPRLGNTLINARAESLARTPAFRAAFKSRRCLVPVSGFYEWKKVDGPTGAPLKVKQPYYIRPAADEPMLLAGLWESWGPKDAPLETYTIVTTAPNEMMAKLHDRMPVVIDPADQSKWLEGTEEQAVALLKPYASELMMSYPVSTRVNSPRINDEGCVERVQEGTRDTGEEKGLWG